jgi:hypothetical protein
MKNSSDSPLAISPKASPQVKQMIQVGDRILLDPSQTNVIRHMISGAQTLVKGAAPFIANLVMQLEAKFGPLENNDEAMLIFHLCGHFIGLAADLGDPEAKDQGKATAQLMTAVHQIMAGGGQQPGQGGPMQQLQGGQQAPGGAPQAAPAAPQSPQPQAGGP